MVLAHTGTYPTAITQMDVPIRIYLPAPIHVHLPQPTYIFHSATYSIPRLSLYAATSAWQSTIKPHITSAREPATPAAITGTSPLLFGMEYADPATNPATLTSHNGMGMIISQKFILVLL